MKSIQPKIVVLNGDIIDVWQFSKRYWPKSHMRVIKQITKWISKGVKVYYVTGNHDEVLRKFTGFKIGSFQIVNKVLLPLPNGEQAWIFHGDVFDVTMKHSKWLAKCGAVGYDTLILLNRVINFISQKILGRGKISLSQKVKNSVKKALQFIEDFENTAAEIAILNGYTYVVCGHIHHPQCRKVENSNGSTLYLNSGDWIENLTALEFYKGGWQIHRYSKTEFEGIDSNEEEELTTSDLFQVMLNEFNQLKAI